MKSLLRLLKKTESFSALSIRLVYLTGKSSVPIHPKHLVKRNKLWFKSYLNRDDLILDIGCGSGVDLIKCAKYVRKAVGLDVDENSLSIADSLLKKSNLKNIKLLKHDANQKLPFKNSSFDKILCSDVLEHLKKRDFTLKEIKRVLKKNGSLFLVVDNPQTSWKRLLNSHGLFFYADSKHFYEYPLQEIKNVLKKNGFYIRSVSTITYDTPLKGFIDLVGGVSLTIYKLLGKWKQKMVKKYPQETTGYKIVAQKVL